MDLDEQAGASDDGMVITEDQLKHMSRHIRDLVPEDATTDDIKDIDKSLNNVFLAAGSPSRAASYRVASWNTLCALLDRLAQNHNGSVQTLLWQGAWSKAFTLYLHDGNLVRPKTARQLLSSLILALRQRHRDGLAKKIEVDVAGTLLSTLLANEDHSRVKLCAQALTAFLSKEIMTLNVVLDALSSSETCSTLDDFLLVLFEWMGKADFGSTIGQLVSIILHRQEQSMHTSNCATSGTSVIWADPLRKAIRLHAVDVASLRVHLLPMLFRRNAHDFFAFLKTLGIDQLTLENDPSRNQFCQTDSDEELLCASLQAGKAIGLVQEITAKQMAFEGGVLSLPIRSVALLLAQSSATARLTGLSLLITSPAITRPFPKESLGLIKRSLSHFFADSDAYFRSDVFGLFQHMLDRLRATTAVLARQIERPAPGASDGTTQATTEILQYHTAFAPSLASLLMSELRPTASYQRHISALKCLSMLIRSGLDARVQSHNLSKSALGGARWPFHLEILNASNCRILLDLVVDPFDDVRQLVASILTLYPTIHVTRLEQLKTTLSRAEGSMLTTGRADQADGVAHLYTLLGQEIEARGGSYDVMDDVAIKLEQMIAMARMDLPAAVENYPVHGLLTSLRYMLADRSHVHVRLSRRLAACLHDIWTVVKPILCNDAPEGYLPESFEQSNEVSTKDTLSYCWRALKEASLLLGSLVTKTVSDEPILIAQTEDLCELSFTQLAELRHRGAFSTVAQTWILCCAQNSARTKLDSWYERVLTILRSKTTINTRRSAGLPSLLCGILIADRTSQLMRRAFEDLEIVARDPVGPALTQEGSLPQVHAMNCMKDMLKNSRLGEQTEPYVPNAFRLAADALQSDAWAVRNCGLMLFRAVIDRLLGTSETYLEDDLSSKKRLSVEQHPQLLDTVLKLLSPSSAELADIQQLRSEGIFPGLQLLQRLDVPNEKNTEVLQLVRQLMGNASWHIRDKAARTYASLLDSAQGLSVLEELLRATVENQNFLHGSLLASKYLSLSVALETGLTGQSRDFDTSLTSRVVRAAHLCTNNTCQITRAAYLDLYAECLKREGLARLSIASEHNPLDIDVFPVETGQDVNLIAGQLALLNQATLPAESASAVVSRTASARLMSIQLLLTTDLDNLIRKEHLPGFLKGLAARDADAAIAFLDTARPLVMRFGARKQVDKLTPFISVAALLLESTESSAAVFCASQELLLAIAATLRSSGVGSDALTDFADALVTRTAKGQYIVPDGQRHADLSVQLLGACLDDAMGYDSLEADIALEYWCNVCCSAIADEGLCSREAAAVTLSKARTWDRLSDLHDTFAETYPRVCFAVYDLLNDDDEDIRLLASRATSSVLASDEVPSGRDLVPLVASSKLIGFMTRQRSTNPTLVAGIFERAFGIADSVTPSVAEALDTAENSDTALFAEEKQNLYIDEAREARIWSQALLRIPITAITPSLRRRLAQWVYEGLVALNTRAQAVPDGPLGWTTKPELFTIGLQVIYGAQVLLYWVQQEARIAVRPSTLRRLLFQLAGVEEMNMLWRAAILRVLESSVRHKVLQVRTEVLEVAREAELGDLL